MTHESAVERSNDGRWIIVSGRRWRATDPTIPEALRQELVDELMSARREVGRARRVPDRPAEAAARLRVHDSKVALGERGDPWWETPSPQGRHIRLVATIMTLVRHRAPGKTICPSDAAGAVGGPGWRSLMDATRDAVRQLATEGMVEVTARGEVLDPGLPWRGPIRIRATG